MARWATLWFLSMTDSPALAETTYQISARVIGKTTTYMIETLLRNHVGYLYQGDRTLSLLPWWKYAAWSRQVSVSMQSSMVCNVTQAILARTSPGMQPFQVHYPWTKGEHMLGDLGNWKNNSFLMLGQKKKEKRKKKLNKAVRRDNPLYCICGWWV